MKKFDAVVTRENIFMLIRYSGITLEEFANIVGLSKRWLQYVKSGTYDFDLTSIDKVCMFFNIDFINLTTTKLKLKSNYRSLLQKHHKNNLEYSKILSEPPSISYVIEFILIKDNEFVESDGMEIRNIRKILDKYGLVYKSSSVSNELQKSKFIKFEKHPKKKGTNLYKRK
jgi:hypothetical protein